MIDKLSNALCPCNRITCYFLFFFLANSIATSDNRIQAPPWSAMDYRVVHTTDLVNRRKAEMFYDRQFYNYTAFTLDDTSSKVFVIGAKASLLVLNGRDLNFIQVERFGERQIADTKAVCDRCKLSVYISLIHFYRNSSTLLICFAYKFEDKRFKLNDDQPTCIVYPQGKLLNFKSPIHVQRKHYAPYSTKTETTSIAARDKFLYVGGPFTNDNDFRIIRRPLPLPHGYIPKKGWLATPETDYRFFNGRTDFIGSFQTSDAVYFVFRETSLEQQLCCKRKIRVTRIARICQNDPGKSFSPHTEFITFQKASLTCPIDASRSFRFKEAQSIFWDEKKELLFAVFTTPDGAPSGSGLCVYHISAFNNAFMGPYKRESAGTELFKQYRNAQPVKCSQLQNVTSDPKARERWRRLQSQIAYSFRLMAYSAHPQRNRANYARFGERWTHVLADRPSLPPTEQRSIVVIFVATEQGTVRKLGLITATRTCEIEEYRIGERVTAMKFLDVKAEDGTNRKTRYLLLTTNKRVLRLPLQRCDRFKTEAACHLARDPYCGWDPSNEECAPFDPKEHTTWTQKLDACSDERHPSNPRWAPWSAWEPCPTLHSTIRGGNEVANTGPNCLCRRQKCLLPTLCAEEAAARKEVLKANTRIQVTNCTVDGSWSPWSFWSGCSASCGRGMRQRTRSCSNPGPQFGGKPCPSSEKSKDVQSCEQMACTDLTPIPIGRWSDWSLWSECSTRCGDGYQRRRRFCHNPGQRCFGDSQEWRVCAQRHTCPILQKFSEWTQWLRDDSIGTAVGQFVKKRFQFVCSATIADPKRIRFAKVIVQEQYCQNKDCSGQSQKRIVVDQDGGWSDWTEWSTCSKTCGSGVQTRHRRCDKPYPSGNGRHCVGNNKDVRQCRTQPCQMWTCWTDWTPCDEDCAQKRTRRCRVGYGGTCSGQRQETRSCTNGNCQGEIYWSQWTAWSECSQQGTQLRERQCSPGKVCFGNNREFKSCFFIEGKSPNSRGNFGVLHLVLTGFICFLFGAMLVAVIVLLVCRPRYLRLQAQLYRAREGLPLASSPDSPAGLTATLHQPPNNLRIVNNIHSNPHGLHSVTSSTTPLLPPRRNTASSGSSTMNRIFEHQAAPPLPPRLTASLSRHRQGSVVDSLCKEAAL